MIFSKNDYVFDHFIFSQRITFLKNTSNRYNKASLKNKLLELVMSIKMVRSIRL